MLMQRASGDCCSLCTAAMHNGLTKLKSDANFYQVPSIGMFIICIYISMPCACSGSLARWREKGH